VLGVQIEPDVTFLNFSRAFSMHRGRHSRHIAAPEFDFSPVSLYHEAMLGSFDAPSVHLESPSGSELGPNLAVIEELEEIRDMIESKSRDLLQKEMQLNQSMDQIHFERSAIIEAVKQECEHMLVSGEARLEKSFKLGTKKLDKLLSRVESRITYLQQLDSRLVVSDRTSASTPPPPQLDGGIDPTDIFDILASGGIPTVRSQLVAGIILLLFARTFGSTEERFFVNTSIACMKSVIMQHFHDLFEVSVHRDVGTAKCDSLEESKFQRAQRGVLLRRLNVDDALFSQPVEIHVHASTLENERDVKVNIRNEMSKSKRLAGLWQISPEDVDGDMLSPWVAFEPASDAKKVSSSLMDRIHSRGFNFRLVSLMYSVSDNEIQALTKTLAGDRVTVRDRFLVFQVGLYLLEWKSREPKARITTLTVVRMMETTCTKTSQDYEALLGLISQWKQGLWFMMKECVMHEGQSIEGTLFFFRILESVNPRDLITAWAPTIILRIEKRLIFDKLVPRIKALIQDRLGS
jgi:hypothetical protein